MLFLDVGIEASACARNSTTSTSRKSIAVDQSRVERGVKSQADRSSRSSVVLDRSCSSTRSISGSISHVHG